MYSYSYDATTGGIVLNSSPTVFSKEPRPVWAAEMNLLGFHQYWNYDEQNDIPYMWAESNAYWYRGTQLAKIKGGDLYTAPELMPTRTEDNRIPFSKEDGFVLQPMPHRSVMVSVPQRVRKSLKSTSCSIPLT